VVSLCVPDEVNRFVQAAMDARDEVPKADRHDDRGVVQVARRHHLPPDEVQSVVEVAVYLFAQVSVSVLLVQLPAALCWVQEY
jgi:hypothetical protein